MSLRERQDQFQQFFRSMPRRSRVLLFTAIFMTFASLPLGGENLSLASDFWIRSAATAAFSGVLAVGYTAVGLGYGILLPAVIALNVLGPMLAGRWLPAAVRPHALMVADVQAIEARLHWLSVVRSVLVVLGYTLFYSVFRLEGRRSIVAHTEIRLAREIHAALVPVASDRSEALEWYGVSHPSGEVGGDLVDVVSSPGAGWHACVADVSGHGVAAGVLMGMFKTALRSAYRTSADPAAALSQVNEVLGPLKQSNMFVTAVSLAWHGPDRFEYVLAGHPSLIHIPRGSTTGRWVGESEMAIGFVDVVSYATRTLAVEPGDLVAVVTDGLIEVFDRGHHELGADGLLPIVAAAASRPTLAGAAGEIFAACAHYGTQSDDQSLLLVRRL
jgi:serine phosphatase RsbU (regulator of sigma subunit)